jgi:hypothetical protein
MQIFMFFCGVATLSVGGNLAKISSPKLSILGAIDSFHVYSHIGGGLIAHVGYICYTLAQFHAWDALPCNGTWDKQYNTR